jgi:hypothetical protein
MKTYLKDILSHAAYSGQGKQHVTLLGATDKF